MKGVVLADPKDSDQLAAAPSRLLECPALQGGLKTRGLARAGEFSWERTAAETLAVYRRVVG